MDSPQEKAPLTVEEAKLRLVRIARRNDSLSPIRRFPLRSAGLALAAGFLWDTLRGGRCPSRGRLPAAGSVTVLPLLLQLAILAAKWGMKVFPGDRRAK